MGSSSNQGKAGKIDIEALFNWLEQQPELEHLRKRADSVVCAYRPGEPTPPQRIILNDKLEIGDQKKGWFRSLKEIVWVPGQSIRGNSFATPELDASLNSVAKLMCISTLWDFFTTIPLFQFSLSGPMGLLSGPGAIMLSFLLLWSSNVAGEGSTNRTKENGSKANWSLAAFIFLCTAKTLFSGVGVDLWIGSKGIASTYAAELAATKLAKDKTELKRLETGDADFQIATKRCAELEEQMKTINRSTNEKQFISLFVQAYGANAVTVADRGLTPKQLIQRYGSVGSIPGVCRQRNALQALTIDKARPLATAIERRSRSIAELPPLAYLKQEEPALFSEHFREADGKFEWVNGTEAVGQATNQFYANLFAGKLGLLGFSLFTLSISVILTGAAALMLYLISLNTQVKASYLGELEQFRDERLDQYQELISDQQANTKI